MKSKAWFFGGAAVGLAVAFGIRLYERIWMLGEVRPVVRWLFWPTSIFIDFRSFLDRSVTLFALVVLGGNAFLYGLLAWKLRRATIGVVALILVAAWIIQPPSDNSLTKQFIKHRSELEQLVQMANSDAQLSTIGPRLIETTHGKKYGTSADQTVLSQSRWAEYRRLFEATGMNDGVHRDTATGDVSLRARTLGRVDPIVVYYGYVHCSAAKGETPRLEPCRDGRDLYDHGGYHWKKLGSEWSIYKVFGGYAIE